MVQKNPTICYYKVPDNKNFKLSWSYGPCHNYSSPPSQRERSHRQQVNNEHGFVPIRLYLQKLIYEFHSMFICHQSFFLFFFSIIKKYKTHSQLTCYKKTSGGQAALVHGPQCADPYLRGTNFNYQRGKKMLLILEH